MQRPLLEGIRVLDVGRFIAAPYAGQLLADLGAEVVRVERPRPEPDRLRGPYLHGKSIYFVTLNRNKKSVAFDMFSDEGRKLLDELISKADILIQNLTVPEILATTETFRLPFERVSTVDDLARDAHARARNLFPQVPQPDLGDVPVARQGLSLSGHEPAQLQPAPAIGEHTASVLQDWLDYTPSQLQALHDNGTLG